MPTVKPRTAQSSPRLTAGQRVMTKPIMFNAALSKIARTRKAELMTLCARIGFTPH